MNKTTRLPQIGVFLCFTLLVLAVIILKNTPVAGYEASIYPHTPALVWVILVFTLVCGGGIIIHQVYTGKENSSYLWLFGLIIVMVSCGILFTVPALREYALYGRGDALTHLGRVQNLADYWVLEKNYYPGFYIINTLLFKVLNIEPALLFAYLPAVYVVLFLPFLYLFARAVLPKKGQAILATFAGTFVLTSSSVVSIGPNGQANMLMPMLFFLCVIYLGREPARFRTRLRYLLIVTIPWLPILHPLPAFMTLLFMLTLWLPAGLFNFIRGRGNKRLVPQSYKVFKPVTLMLLILFASWMYYSGGLVSGESRITSAVTDPGVSHVTTQSTGPVTTQNDVLEVRIKSTGLKELDGLLREIAVARHYGYGIWDQFFKRFGELLLFIIVMAACVPLLIKKLPSNKELGKLFSLYGLPLICLPFIGLLLWIDSPFGFGRVFFYVTVIGAVFAGYALDELLRWIRGSRRVLYLLPLIVLIALLSVNGVFKTYYSRYTLTPSSQVTRSEIEGMTWFFDNKDARIGIISGSTAVWRYADLLLSPEEKKQRPDIPGPGAYTILPYHFNYDTQDMLGKSFFQDTYMLISDVDRITYVETYPEMAEFRFYPADFEKLENDPSIKRLYSKDGFEVWYIYGLKGKIL